jgi:hypothetical protein
VVSRSFRVPPDVDKMLDKEAARRGWTKSFLIKEIIFNWFVYHKALGDRTPTHVNITDAGDSKIDLTPAMIKAGEEALLSQLGGAVEAFWNPHDLAISVYQAMARVPMDTPDAH